MYISVLISLAQCRMWNENGDVHVAHTCCQVIVSVSRCNGHRLRPNALIHKLCYLHFIYITLQHSLRYALVSPRLSNQNHAISLKNTRENFSPMIFSTFFISNSVSVEYSFLVLWAIHFMELVILHWISMDCKIRVETLCSLCHPEWMSPWRKSLSFLMSLRRLHNASTAISALQCPISKCPPSPGPPGWCRQG